MYRPGHLPQHVFVLVTQLLEQCRSNLSIRRLVMDHAVQVEVVRNDVSHCLCVCSRTGSTTPDSIVDLRQFIRDSIGNIGSGGSSAVGSQYHSILEVDCHTGCCQYIGSKKRKGIDSLGCNAHIDVPRLRTKEVSTLCILNLKHLKLIKTYLTSPFFK